MLSAERTMNARLQSAINSRPSEDAVTKALEVADSFRALAAGRLDIITELRAKLQAEQYAKAMHVQRIDSLTASNAALRLEIDRLGSPEHASNSEAAAWRWATGNDAQTIAVCELDGTEWIPVTSSRYGLAAVAAEIAARNYGPQWSAGSVLARMALGAERGE